ncbi:hypothetical protein [Pseudogemmobacter bohemicus]|uniref:hypothetical protein n=1 Tax=Pseudogemmobacter bohemicus TaxID=2250708 RepID=UPI000DD3E9F3|nr:hypothetical protein [Pseudogemmobacter bohemicus]
MAQNDDVAPGAIAEIQAAGLRPGEDILVVGARPIGDGRQLATSGNSPACAAAILTGRIFYDVSHDWVAQASERLLNWPSLTVTVRNVEGHIDRYVGNDGVDPFDWRKIPKVLHPSDRDPQAGVGRPAGWEYPADCLAARDGGEWERVRADYADHHRIKLEGPSPDKAA